MNVRMYVRASVRACVRCVMCVSVCVCVCELLDLKWTFGYPFVYIFLFSSVHSIYLLYRYTKKAMHLMYLPSPNFLLICICIYGSFFTRLFSVGQPVPGTSGMVGGERADAIIEDFHTMIVLLFLEIAIFCKS